MEKSGDEGGKGAASKAAEVLVSSFRVTLDPACMDAPSMILNTSSVDASVRSAAVRGPARSLVSSIRSADGSLREDFKRSGDEVDLHHGPAQVSEWYNTTANLLAEVMGTGLLSLPSTVAGLGYILGSISIVTFAVAIFYSGSVLAKVKNRYAKHVLSYGDMAFILHGKPFEVATRWLLYANWYFLMCYYTLALASSLQAAFYWNESLCFWMWGLIGCAILLPFIQLRTLHAISYMSFASTVSIIAAVAVIVASFLTGNTEEGANYVPATLGVPKQSFLSGYTNLANIIFAFQGQSMFYEMAAEMKNPRHFAVPSLLTAQVIMCFFYLFTALIAYTYGGQNVNGFILYSLPQNKLRTVCAILIAFHILVAYVITGQPLVYKVHEAISKETLHTGGVKAASIHFGITSTLLVGAYVVSNLIPFFADMQGIIAAFAAAPIVFFFPAYFYAKAAMKAGEWAKMLLLEKFWLGVMIFVLFPFCFVVGLIAAFASITESWSGVGFPFQCVVASQL